MSDDYIVDFDFSDYEPEPLTPEQIARLTDELFPENVTVTFDGWWDSSAIGEMIARLEAEGIQN